MLLGFGPSPGNAIMTLAAIQDRRALPQMIALPSTNDAGNASLPAIEVDLSNRLNVTLLPGTDH